MLYNAGFRIVFTLLGRRLWDLHVVPRVLKHTLTSCTKLYIYIYIPIYYIYCLPKKQWNGQPKPPTALYEVCIRVDYLWFYCIIIVCRWLFAQALDQQADHSHIRDMHSRIYEMHADFHIEINILNLICLRLRTP